MPQILRAERDGRVNRDASQIGRAVPPLRPRFIGDAVYR
jgi:hypothetical protein